jgi:hypothetical protein
MQIFLRGRLDQLYFFWLCVGEGVIWTHGLLGVSNLDFSLG